MSNRFEHEFPHASWEYAIPPIGPDGHQVYLQRARQARAEVMSAALRGLAHALAGAGAATARSLRRAWSGPAGHRRAA